jgi:hypothetical protein
MKLSYVGNKNDLMEFITYVIWCEQDAIKKGFKVEKVFSDFSGYVAK